MKPERITFLHSITLSNNNVVGEKSRYSRDSRFSTLTSENHLTEQKVPIKTATDGAQWKGDCVHKDSNEIAGPPNENLANEMNGCIE
jgi:hypothetical protein